MSRIVLKLLNGIYGWIIGSVVMVSAVYAGYSMWDNSQIYQAAENVQDQIRQLKPDEDAKGGPGFDELRALNGEVVGWLTVDGTNIDYPILQGDTNLDYMNKDVYGEFSLAGSIFLDVRNKPDFSDNYSLIYGHNMDEHLMFGDLALFKEKEFFQKNTTATVMIPGESRKYQVAAVLQISAGTEEIFNPDKWKDNLDGLGKYLEENSIWYHQQLIDLLKKSPDRMEAVSLVTCSDGSTNDRTVLILVRENPKKPQIPDTPGGGDTNGGDDSPGNGGNTTPGSNDPGNGSSGSDISGNGPKKTGDTQNRDLWMYLIGGIILFIIGFETVDRIREKRHKD